MDQNPIVFLAFANEHAPTLSQHYLRNLPEEIRRLQTILEQVVERGLCELVLRPNVTLDEILDVFQRHRDRIAIFHFGGHANGYQLLLESQNGTAVADAGGLAAFLGQQNNLKLVFLNGCSTQQQVQGLLNAGVPVVIATDRAVDDAVATAFAERFYRGLAGGARMRVAFNEAAGAVRADRGETALLRKFAAHSETEAVQTGRWPWELYTAEGAEQAAEWNLPAAVNDPLFGLPPLPSMDLPERPFRYLNWFRQEDAPIYFGRGHQIRDLYTRVVDRTGAPIVLLYGQSGVGKSSLLAAGLLPRLVSEHEVRYLRRNQETGLLGTLASAFSHPCDTREKTDLAESWRAREDEVGKPLTVILDQAEELYTHSQDDPQAEMNLFLDALAFIFADRHKRPQGKLILGFRKEWLAEIEKRLAERNLPRSKVFLERLDRRGIVDSVTGVSCTPALQQYYGLTVGEGLAEEIADDLLADHGSAVAPTLQILLTKLWERAKERDYDHPRCDQGLYHALKAEGLRLEDFLDQQLERLRRIQPAVLESGLALDLLAFHTTRLGTAEQRSLIELREGYRHQEATMLDLIRRFQDLYLLTDPLENRPVEEKATRLVHDTLAPIVRARFDESDLPGQRARRILENHRSDWINGQEGSLLDETDLVAVERGLHGMQAWNPDEIRLIQGSRSKHTRSVRAWLSRAAMRWHLDQRSNHLLWHNKPVLARRVWEFLQSETSVQLSSALFKHDPFARLDAILESHDCGLNGIETDFISQGLTQHVRRAQEVRLESIPYLGFSAYAEEHKDIFFGRDSLVESLYNYVKTRPLTIIAGGWSTGKSSLVEAGLIPYLRSETSEQWTILSTVYPGKNPLQSFWSLPMNAPGSSKKMLSVSSHWSTEALASLLAHHPRQKFLLFIDQLETLITECQDEAERQLFLESLLDILQARLERLHIVTAVRAGFELAVMESELAAFGQSPYPINEKIEPEQMRQIIEGPAFMRGLRLEPDLVTRTVQDLHDYPQSLPLLSLTLKQIWVSHLAVKSSTQPISSMTYHPPSTISGCLHKLVTDTYEELDEPRKRAMQRILLQMVTTRDGKPTPQEASLRADLKFQNQQENEYVAEVVRKLLDKRIIVEDLKRDNDEPQLVFSHPLLAEWENLFIWRQELETANHLKVPHDQQNRPLAPFARNLAVVIGINRYNKGFPSLRTAVNDARRLASILECDHGYQVSLLDSDVTLSRLDKLFAEELVDQVHQEDRLLVYFAGHGVAFDGDDLPRGYLFPQDAHPDEPSTAFSLAVFFKYLAELPCRHLLVILDCCFTSRFRWAGQQTLRPLPDILYQERYDHYIQNPAWQVITSTAYDQEALDVMTGDILGGRGETYSHSVFAQALFSALAGEADIRPRDTGDGVITASELYLYLRDTIEFAAEKRRLHLRQTPSIWSLRREYNRGEYIFLVPGHGELNLPPAPELNLDNNPYKGLSSYDYKEKDARLFFGREKLEEELAALVAAQSLTVVLGASGTGKSSLVKAGLLPRLAGWQRREGEEPTEIQRRNGTRPSRGSTVNGRTQGGSKPLSAVPNWHILPPLRPTAHPLRTLYAVLGTLSTAPADGQDRDRKSQLTRIDSQASAIEGVEHWLDAHPDRFLLLTVDQFEELITLCRDDQERKQFLDLLARLVSRHSERFRLILTLRSDFEPQFTDSPLAPFWSPARFVVPPMDQDDLRRTIERPASERVLYFEPPELVDRLINEVIQTPGALPLLSFTLSELYIKYVESESDNRSLTQEHYDELGGVIGSLRVRAEEEYARLPDDGHRVTMRRVMLRMMAVEGGTISRRRVPRSELVYVSEAENWRVEEVLRRLVDARLLIAGLDDGGEDYIEPAHDTLVQAWDRLLGWKQAAEEYLPLQRRVADAAQDWEQADKHVKNALLISNSVLLPRLQEVLLGQQHYTSWLHQFKAYLWPDLSHTDHNTWLNALESQFVRQSIVRIASRRRLIVSVLFFFCIVQAITLVVVLTR